MRMLAESMFPSDEARAFFREDLGGELTISTTYDYLQIDAKGRNSDLVVLLETLSNAISNPQIDKEITDSVRSRVAADLASQLGDQAKLADRIAAKRLFGEFPYGRPSSGSPESLGKIDFADLRFAYGRFFGADNATLTIRGNVDPNNAYRAARRFFGGWLKSDRLVPSTFKQPNAPDTSLEVLNLDSPTAEVRHSVRGFSKADPDFAASEVLAQILDERLKRRVMSVDRGARSWVRNEAHVLPGQLVFAISVITPENKVKLYPAGESVDARGLIPFLLADPISLSEFESARSTVISRIASRPVDQLWLDSDTYKVAPNGSQSLKAEAVKLSDVQRVAAAIKTRPAISLWMVKGMGTK